MFLEKAEEGQRQQTTCVGEKGSVILLSKWLSQGIGLKQRKGCCMSSHPEYEADYSGMYEETFAATSTAF